MNKKEETKDSHPILEKGKSQWKVMPFHLWTPQFLKESQPIVSESTIPDSL